ncbi:MAG: hypothetical protein KJ648_07035 [Candidatus Omnitrophica bacterium]|nr:hypothetical protein [Candidatus Omnitrophota bacterium]MBU1767837.1 hypothetical protein [Candidatus Omnitrophota bacterium]
MSQEQTVAASPNQYLISPKWGTPGSRELRLSTRSDENGVAVFKAPGLGRFEVRSFDYAIEKPEEMADGESELIVNDRQLVLVKGPATPELCGVYIDASDSIKVRLKLNGAVGDKIVFLFVEPADEYDRALDGTVVPRR